MNILAYSKVSRLKGPRGQAPVPPDAPEIAFFGVSSTPSDNGTQAGPGPVSITPPASMRSGDLVLVAVQYRGTYAGFGNGNTPRMYDSTNAATEHGGQDWNYYRPSLDTNCSARLFWCRFNGTWSADPSWRIDSGTGPLSVVMLVFRPTNSSKYWIANVGPSAFGFVAGSSPFTKTITGVTTTTKFSSQDHVAIAGWFTPDENTWGNLTGSGWSQTSLGAQYRNQTASLQSAAFAYQVQTASGATGNVTLDQTANGGDAGAGWIISFTQIDLPTTGTAGTGAVVQNATKDIETAGSSTDLTATFGSAVTSGNTVIGYVHFEDNTSQPEYLVEVSDDQGNKYYPLRMVEDAAFTQQSHIFFLPNITNGPTALTAKLSHGNSFAYSILVAEFNGAWHFHRSAAVDHRAQDAFSPEMVTCDPAITPPVDGSLAFLGMHITGSQQASDFWNQQDSFTEIAEIIGNGASRPNAAIASFVQGSAASLTGRSQGDKGAAANMILGIFKPAS